MSLRSRLPDVQAAKQMAVVKQRDGKGRVGKVQVPGHEVYRTVLIGRTSDGPYPHLYAECHLNTKVGLVPCEGNGPHRYGSTCCYHALGAVERRLEEGGFEIVGWFDSQEKMVKSRNLKQFAGCEPGHLYARKWGRNFPGVWFLWKRR